MHGGAVHVREMLALTMSASPHGPSSLWMQRALSPHQLSLIATDRSLAELAGRLPAGLFWNRS